MAGQLGKAAWGCSDNLSFSSEINCGAEGFSKLDHHELYVPLNEKEHAVISGVRLRMKSVIYQAEDLDVKVTGLD